MNQQDYQKLWDNYFAPQIRVPMPDFLQFTEAERLLQDYLDIFRGNNSRVAGQPTLYEHPFFKPNGSPKLESIPQIRYILIGECRMPLKAPKLNECVPFKGDTENTYFYDIRHVKPTPYFNKPLKVWEFEGKITCPREKAKALLHLASNGVLLLDLFPFAINYTTGIRQSLNEGGITKSFWDDPLNPYNLKSRICSIRSLLHEEWDLTMIAPVTISAHIVNPINGFAVLPIVPTGLHPSQFQSIGMAHQRHKNAANYRKVAIASSGFTTAELIGLSF
jgi:hypothetical protein